MHSSVAGPSFKRILYRNHIPTSRVQKIAMAIGSGLSVLSDPTKTDMLAVLGEVTALHSLQEIHQAMCQDPLGIQILNEKPRIRKECIDFQTLSELPTHTFGHQYAEFMKKHAFDPDERAIVQYVDDEELAYIMQRFRELHDFWHVLLGLPPTEFGEIVLKYVELVQTGLPVCALSSLLGPLRLNSVEREQLRTNFIPWAHCVGKNASNLLCVKYEEEFQTPLEDLRVRLNVTIAPQLEDLCGPNSGEERRIQ